MATGTGLNPWNTAWFLAVLVGLAHGAMTLQAQTITVPLTTSYSWSGLSIYGGYEVSVTCTSSVTATQTPVTASCTTDEGIPLVGPSNVTATATSYNQMVVDWNDLAAISKRGVLQGFKLIYFKDTDAVPQTVTLSAATFSHTLNSLNTGTMYIVSVLGYTSVGDGPQSTGVETTWKTDNSTVYYCYQLIPGTLEFDAAGQEMSCIAYAAVMAIMGCFSVVLLLMVLCLCCCGGGGGGGGGGGETVVVIEQASPEPPCYSPEPQSIATARDVGFDEFDDEPPTPKSRNAWMDDMPQNKIAPIQEADDDDW